MALTDPTSLQSDLGEQVRRLRLEQGLTLEEVSARSSVSIGSLSQIERGKGNPAFFTLLKIAHALGVPVARFFHIERAVSPVVRRGEGKQLNPHPHTHPGRSTSCSHPISTVRSRLFATSCRPGCRPRTRRSSTAARSRGSSCAGRRRST
jgi:DNA-binding XRE family transcriptional regulator